MNLYTLGFTQKTASEFFSLIQRYNIRLLLDIRLNNKSQLAGFTKGDDLNYFLTTICKCDYRHCLEFAPTQEILEAYRKKRITWDEYVTQYNALMVARNSSAGFLTKYEEYSDIVLLCSEPSPDHCHRRLLAEMILLTNAHIDLKHL